MSRLAPSDSKLLAHIRPVGRPATAEDVAEGNATFRVDGKRQRAKMTLPAVAVLRQL
jgi:hypothetical protein